MDISANMSSINATQQKTNIKTNFTEKISKDEVKEIKEAISQNAREIMMSSTTVQSSVAVSNAEKFKADYEEFQAFLKDVGYDGKPIAELSQDEAAELVSEDGFFGIDQTSERIANFVINGAGGDESLLRAGREGMLQGFKDAEAMWGGELPEISQKTMQKALELVDKAMYDLGYSVLDTEA
jgi:hypothetical protein